MLLFASRRVASCGNANIARLKSTAKSTRADCAINATPTLISAIDTQHCAGLITNQHWERRKGFSTIKNWLSNDFPCLNSERTA